MKGYNHKLHTELTDTIRTQCGKIEDIEGYVYNRLLFDDGDSGAEYYKVSMKEFKNCTLNAMEEVLKATK